MSSPPSESSNPWSRFVLGAAIVIALLFIVVILFLFPEDRKGNCIAVVSITVGILSAFYPLLKKYVAAYIALVVLILFVWGGVFVYALLPSREPVSPEGPAVSDPLPPDPPLDKEATAIEPTEIAPTEDGMNFLSADEMEENLAEASDYFPALKMRDCRHLFLSLTEEFPEEDVALEYQSLILEHTKDWSIGELKSLITQQFDESYQSVEDFPAVAVNANAEIGALIERIDELESKIKQARATNGSVLPYYEDLSELYLKVTELAPRGEFYVQLARPYEEGILRMKRVEAKEKNAVFLWAANAVLYFRTAMTYKAPVGDSVSDIFYRIAKVYHYAGDTPGLQPEIRSYFYRVSAAYLGLSAQRETLDDTYYGYSTYYGAMVYHKLAIITPEKKEKMEYLELAEQNYNKADTDYSLDQNAKDEIDHALSDIKTRKLGLY